MGQTRTKTTKKTKPYLFFNGKPITYSAKRGNLQVNLTLTGTKKSEWKRGVDWIYNADVQASWTDEGMCKSQAGWSYHPYWLHEQGSFGGLFKEMVDYSGIFTGMLQVRQDNRGPNKSDLIRCVHSIEDEVKRDFLDPRPGWTDMKKELLEKYFEKEQPYEGD